ncbi:hypothetical protein NG796_00855 [Laspinema sp. A4]|uniref:hypothetical protein n=1 Tax=Laspinema sp. D2d TaxID=2953686 RepID=UPI0021BAC22B|nr:hypothetical protein [Laspinema sp. D2d]MCT7981834.1 hypothetical protein [Laspinema sp. D2d]
MNAKLLSIEPKPKPGKFKLVVSIGDNCHEFAMTGETDKIADRQINVINGDKIFWDLFQFNQHLAQVLYKLTAQAYNGEKIELPQEIGEFYPDKPALLERHR